VPHHDGPLELLVGPERIESGWWDGDDVAAILRRPNTERSARMDLSRVGTAKGDGICTAFSPEAVYSPSPPTLSCTALSNFTFLRGASHSEELVKRAAALGYRALALTDECSLAGVVRAHVAAKDVGLPLVIGSRYGCKTVPAWYCLPPTAKATAICPSSSPAAGAGRKKGGYSLCRGRSGGRTARLPSFLLAPDGRHDAEHARFVAERFRRPCLDRGGAAARAG